MTAQDKVRQAEFAWNLFCELRKELVESQRLRAQIIGAKVTFVGTGVAIIAANLQNGVDIALLVVPAFAAIFFDFLVNSYSYSVNRIGRYTRTHLEPIFREGFSIPEEVKLWQEFLLEPGTRQVWSLYGNLGLTFLTVAAGVVALFHPFRQNLSLALLISLLFFVLLDIWSSFFARKGKSRREAASEI